jgi:hypothetical protein
MTIRILRELSGFELCKSLTFTKPPQPNSSPLMGENLFHFNTNNSFGGKFAWSNSKEHLFFVPIHDNNAHPAGPNKISGNWLVGFQAGVDSGYVYAEAKENAYSPHSFEPKKDITHTLNSKNKGKQSKKEAVEGEGTEKRNMHWKWLLNGGWKEQTQMNFECLSPTHFYKSPIYYEIEYYHPSQRTQVSKALLLTKAFPLDLFPLVSVPLLPEDAAKAKLNQQPNEPSYGILSVEKMEYLPLANVKRFSGFGEIEYLETYHLTPSLNTLQSRWNKTRITGGGGIVSDDGENDDGYDEYDSYGESGANLDDERADGGLDSYALVSSSPVVLVNVEHTSTGWRAAYRVVNRPKSQTLDSSSVAEVINDSLKVATGLAPSGMLTRKARREILEGIGNEPSMIYYHNLLDDLYVREQLASESSPTNAAATITGVGGMSSGHSTGASGSAAGKTTVSNSVASNEERDYLTEMEEFLIEIDENGINNVQLDFRNVYTYVPNAKANDKGYRYYSLRPTTASEHESFQRDFDRKLAREVAVGDYLWLWMSAPPSLVGERKREELLVKCISAYRSVYLFEIYPAHRLEQMTQSLLSKNSRFLMVNRENLFFLTNSDEPAASGLGGLKVKARFISSEIDSIQQSLDGSAGQLVEISAMIHIPKKRILYFILNYLLYKEKKLNSLTSCFFYHAAVSIPQSLVYAAEMLCVAIGSKPVTMVS